MNIETLEKGIAIKENIDTVEAHRATLRKFYAKKDKLTHEETERLFAIASSSIDELERKYTRELEKL